MGFPQLLMIGASAAQGVMQMSHARANAQAQAEAGAQNIEFQRLEAHEQQRESDIQAQEAKSDRVRQTNAQIARAQVLAGERGLSGTTRSALVRHIGMIEGSDMARIDSTRRSQQRAAHSRTQAAGIEAQQQTQRAINQSRVASTGAFFNTVGTGLRIWGQNEAHQESLNQI